MTKSPWEDATGVFDLDAFISDLTSMAPTITDIMTTRQSELSRICLKKFQEPGGRERVEATAAALSDLSKRGQGFSSLCTEAWLYLQAELNDPGGRA
jgi:hypothetical protein